MLQALSVYLLKVFGISCLLYLYYCIALRNKSFHYYNRFYLLMAVIISAVLPLLQLQWFTVFSSSEKAIHLFGIMNGTEEEEVNVTNNTGLSIEQIILCAAAIISFYLIMVQCRQILKIQRLKKRYPVQELIDFDFINTDISSAPFSFLKSIFWRSDIDLSHEAGRQILQHEIAHVKEKHSLDKLFMQFIMCFYWINPVFYFIKKELYLIHEFIADEKAVKYSDADAFARMLLTAQFGKFNFLPAQSIFYSPIKRRLIMLTKSKRSQFSYVRRLMVLPLLAALVCLFAFSIKNESSNSSVQKTVAAKTFILVVDAGHGGKDNGAIANGLTEKNVTLKIAEKIKALSAGYNINVVLTRNNDVFMSPADKSNFANAQNADAFISIHANADNKNDQQKGFEILLAKNNTQTSPSALFGSAILQNLQPDFHTTPALMQRNGSIYVLEKSMLPAALIECGYLTNVNDAEILKNDAKIELIAKAILSGTALYANNKNGIEQKDIIQPDTSGPSRSNSTTQTPLYVIDGEIASKEKADKLDPKTIESVNVLKDKSATDKYGEKGKNGVVEITSKKGVVVTKIPDNILYVLDGKIVSKDAVDKINKKEIESMNVLKDKDATDKYGDKGKNGVIEITMKKS